MDPISIGLGVAQAVPALMQLFKKKPKSNWQGMNADELEKIMAAIRTNISKSTGSAIDKSRIASASRGGYRSGLQPQLEGQIRQGGVDSEAQAIAQLLSQNSQSRQQYNQYQYGQNLQDYRTGQDAAGQNLGGILDRFMSSRNKKKPAPTYSGGAY